ncbi:hypothetical protein KM043_017393 [Ampulex compressa]|nr:hypothetical protein KM043_017393 [Ampulex compressa]
MSGTGPQRVLEIAWIIKIMKTSKQSPEEELEETIPSIIVVMVIGAILVLVIPPVFLTDSKGTSPIVRESNRTAARLKIHASSSISGSHSSRNSLPLKHTVENKKIGPSCGKQERFECRN